MRDQSRIMKFIFRLTVGIVLICFPYSSLAQSKPKRDISKDQNTIVSKQKGQTQHKSTAGTQWSRSKKAEVPIKNVSSSQISTDNTESIPTLSISEPTGSLAGVEYVDLGLPSGNLWATRNIGAETTNDYGYYYSWGAKNSTTNYNGANCPTLDLDIYDISGSSNYDVVADKYGSKWVIPTQDDLNELLRYCDAHNYRNGILFVSKFNDKSIFLPAGGEMAGFSNVLKNWVAYWCSTSYNVQKAYCLTYDIKSTLEPSISHSLKFEGLNIRPVYKKNEPNRVACQSSNQPITEIQTQNYISQDANNDYEHVIKVYEYVDLGLPSGTKWATHNIGADSPAGFGDYFAWGELSVKSEYTKDNNIWFTLKDTGLKINHVINNNMNLFPNYDVANVKWGGQWHIPTKDQMNELIDKCSWKWTEMDGHRGYKVKGPNGKSIFLPAGGYKEGDSLIDYGIEGNYWSASVADVFYSYYLNFNMSTDNLSHLGRFYGLNIRPVMN